MLLFGFRLSLLRRSLVTMNSQTDDASSPSQNPRMSSVHKPKMFAYAIACAIRSNHSTLSNRPELPTAPARSRMLPFARLSFCTPSKLSRDFHPARFSRLPTLPYTQPCDSVCPVCCSHSTLCKCLALPPLCWLWQLLSFAPGVVPGCSAIFPNCCISKMCG